MHTPESAVNRPWAVFTMAAIAAAFLATAASPTPASAQSGGPTVRREFIGPSSLFTQAVVVRGGGVRTIYLSGQVGKAGTDLKTQITDAYQNLLKQLAAAGGAKEDLVKVTVYIVNYQPEHLAVWRDSMLPLITQAGRMPANTLIGVQALAIEGLLVEVEAIAVAADK